MQVTWQQLVGPAALSCYIMVITLTIFVLAVRGLPWWYQLLVGVFASLAITGLWLTCLVDPGVIPAAAAPDALVQQLDAGLPVPDAHLYSRDGRGSWMKRTPQGRAEAWTKYCPTCHVWRPPRSHHCSTCNACMEHWDHHCSVVGNCIARRNHRFFAGFLVCAQLACLLGLGGALWRLELRGLAKPGTWMGAENFLLIFLAVVYGYHATVLLFGSVHCLALVFDITTKDLLTDKHLWVNPPCCPGSTRSPANLLHSWHGLCCLPVTCRPWQRQRTWRQLPTIEDAPAALPAGNHSRLEHGALLQQVAGAPGAAAAVASAYSPGGPNSGDSSDSRNADVQGC